MADLQWLKLSTNFFDNNKIKLLESEKDGDTIIVVYVGHKDDNEKRDK